MLLALIRLGCGCFVLPWRLNLSASIILLPFIYSRKIADLFLPTFHVSHELVLILVQVPRRELYISEQETIKGRRVNLNPLQSLDKTVFLDLLQYPVFPRRLSDSQSHVINSIDVDSWATFHAMLYAFRESNIMDECDFKKVGSKKTQIEGRPVKSHYREPQ